MCESPQHPNGPWHCARRSPQRSTQRTGRGLAKFRGIPNDVRSIASVLLCIALTTAMQETVGAQPSPWERAASNLEQTFTGPLARSLALVAIVIGGLMFMFGEGGAKRQISGIVFGGGLALFATQFLTWLF
jgi:type IV secretory pathway VirB2 component (pilin)